MAWKAFLKQKIFSLSTSSYPRISWSLMTDTSSALIQRSTIIPSSGQEGF